MMSRGHIIINEELCKGCEFCTVVCPYNLIQIAAYYNSRGYRPAMFTNPGERCTGCTLCAMLCPEAAITVFREATLKGVSGATAPEAVAIQKEAK
jgi:2-oxoglutarate ferredoxin oxidoreductase subunit delta